MTTPDKKTAFAGLNLADELKDFQPIGPEALPPKPNPQKLKVLSTEAGFPSRPPQPVKRPVVRPVLFESRLTLRVAEDDKTRFEDLVYRLRTSNGEAFRLAVDALEAVLKDRDAS